MSPRIIHALLAGLFIGIGIGRQTAPAKTPSRRSAWPDLAGEFAL